MLVSGGMFTMRFAHDIVRRFLGQVMVHLDGLGLTITMAFVTRVAWAADIGGADGRDAH
jgi:hypothetical protein